MIIGAVFYWRKFSHNAVCLKDFNIFEHIWMHGNSNIVSHWALCCLLNLHRQDMSPLWILGWRDSTWCAHWASWLSFFYPGQCLVNILQLYFVWVLLCLILQYCLLCWLVLYCRSCALHYLGHSEFCFALSGALSCAGLLLFPLFCTVQLAELCFELCCAGLNAEL